MEVEVSVLTMSYETIQSRSAMVGKAAANKADRSKNEIIHSELAKVSNAKGA